MIPVLGIPVLNRPDLLAACLASIDHPIGRLVIIDNSPTGEMGAVAEGAYRGELFVTEPPANLGFAASINLVIRTHPGLPWWAFANADVVFAPGDLARLESAMTGDGPRCVCLLDWRAFGINARCVDRVGLWDENYHPAYVEDCDWEWRCALADVPIHRLPSDTSHVGSVILGEERYARHNARTHAANLEYHAQKWGGYARGGERFLTPFDRGGWVGDWTLDIRRLARQAWD